MPLPDASPVDDGIGEEPPGRYVLGKEIGRGGQARILLATDRTARLWNVELGEPSLWLLLGAVPADIAISPDGRELVLTDEDSTVAYPLDTLPAGDDPLALLEAAEADAAVKLKGFELE